MIRCGMRISRAAGAQRKGGSPRLGSEWRDGWRKIEPGKRIEAILAAGDKLEVFDSQRREMAFLAHLDEGKLRIEAELDERPAQAVTLTAGTVEIFLPLAGMVDIEAERERIRKEIEGLERDIARTEKLLSNENFLRKAPRQVVEKERAKLADYQARMEKLREMQRMLGG